MIVCFVGVTWLWCVVWFVLLWRVWMVDVVGIMWIILACCVVCFQLFVWLLFCGFFWFVVFCLFGVLFITGLVIDWFVCCGEIVLFYIGLTIYFGILRIVVVVRFGVALFWFVLGRVWWMFTCICGFGVCIAFVGLLIWLCCGWFCF